MKEALGRVEKPLELRFTVLDGTEVDVRNFRGKVVLLDFWATWCPPCIVGAVNKIKPIWQALHDQRFEVIGISYGTDRKVLERFIKKNGLSWPQFFAEDGKGNPLVKSLGAPDSPAYWLIDSEGAIVDMAPYGDLENKAHRLLAIPAISR